MNACDKHPQRQQIIDALLAGETLRAIGARVVPPVHHTTLARFKVKIIAPAVRSMKGVSVNARDLKEIAHAAGIGTDPASAQERYSEDLRRLVQQRVEARLVRRGGWISEAEKRPILDSNGNVYNDMDHRALAAHDRNEGTDLEFMARLGGLLSDSPAVHVTNVVAMPDAQVQVNIGQPPARGGE